jgi:hypothetical protein
MAGHPDDKQLQAWGASTKGHERVAAVIARWASGQDKWTMVPDTKAFHVDAPPATITKALNLLVEFGVLVKESTDYFVAADR